MSDTRPGPALEETPSRIKAFVHKCEPFLRKLRQFQHYATVHRSGRLLSIQGVCAFFVLYGISYYSVPIALMIGGAAGVLAVERQTH